MSNLINLKHLDATGNNINALPKKLDSNLTKFIF